MSNLSTAGKTIKIATCGDTREGVPSHTADPEIMESSSEEGEIKADMESSSDEGETRKDPKSGKRRRSPDEQSAKKRMKGPEPDAFNFSDIFHVRGRLKCIIQVNDLTPFGTFENTTRGWMICMFMDPGRYRSPMISLSFSKGGGREQWRSTWDVDSYLQGGWAMDELTHTRISDRNPLDFNSCDYRAIMACSDESEKNRLMSMKFRSWANVIGFNRSSTLPPQEPARLPKSCRPSMNTIFHPQESYMLTIWFIAPYKRELFQRNCLWIYTRALAARRPPLYNFIDDSGARFSAFTSSGDGNRMALSEHEQSLAPKASTTIDLEEEGEPEESISMRRDKTEVESHRQYPHLGLQSPQPTSKPGPGLTGEFPIHERDMEVSRQLATPSYPLPLQAESDRASVERGSKAAPELSRARSDTSPNRTVGSDISPRPISPLSLLELKVPNVMDLSGTPTGTRVDRSPESPPSPKNGSGSSMAYQGSEAAPLDLETTAKGSADPHDPTELTLTTERPSSPPPPTETNENPSFSLLREDSPTPPREYGGAVPSFLFGPLQADDESEEDESEEGEEDEPEEGDGDGSEG